MAVAPTLHAPTERIDVRLRVLPGEAKPLRVWLPVRLHHAAADVAARLVPLSEDGVAPGGSGYAQLVLDRPIAAAVGDRFVLRETSSRRTIGGGAILDLRPPSRHRRSPERLARLDALSEADPGRALSRLLNLPPFALDLTGFLRDRALAHDALAAIMDRLGSVAFDVDGGTTVLAAERWQAYEAALLQAVESFHAEHPDLQGLGSERLRLALEPRLPRPAFLAALARIVDAGKAVTEGSWVRMPGHEARLNPADEAFWSRIAPHLSKDVERFRPPRVRDLAVLTGEPETEVRRICKLVGRSGRVDQVAPDHFFARATVAEMAEIVRDLSRHEAKGLFSAAQFRDRVDNGRKVAIQILEFFDRHGLTIRRGDMRRLNPHRADLFPRAATAQRSLRIEGLAWHGSPKPSRTFANDKGGCFRERRVSTGATIADEIVRPLDLEPDRAGREDRSHYGVVDIGSNSVRLVVYDELARAPLPRFNEKSLCRLGEGLAQTGAIAPENFRRTVEAVRRFRAIADAMGVKRLDATATEAMRRASNGAELSAAITAESGLAIRILSGAEEARYAALGVISGFFRPVGLVGDMGGGSLEVAEALDDHVGERWVSLPLGALPVEALLEKGIDHAKRRIDAMLAEGLPPALTNPVFYPVGGGWRALAKAHMAAVGAPVPVVHGYTLDAATVRAFAKSLWRPQTSKSGSPRDRAGRRARTLPAAALVLDRVLKRLAPEKVVFSALGLREGWLYAQLSEAERYRDPLIEGAQMVGVPAARVAGFAARPRAVDGRALSGETAAEARLRVAACALSDIAWRDHPDIRASETFRRLLQFRSSASTTPSGCSSRPPSMPATTASPTIPASRRPSTCCRAIPAAVPPSWVAP